MKRFQVDLDQLLSIKMGGNAYHAHVKTNVHRLRKLMAEGRIKELNPPLPKDDSKGIISWIKKLYCPKDDYSIVVKSYTNENLMAHMVGPQQVAITFLIPKTPETVKQDGDKILIEIGRHYY